MSKLCICRSLSNADDVARPFVLSSFSAGYSFYWRLVGSAPAILRGDDTYPLLNAQHVFMHISQFNSVGTDKLRAMCDTPVKHFMHYSCVQKRGIYHQMYELSSVTTVEVWRGRIYIFLMAILEYFFSGYLKCGFQSIKLIGCYKKAQRSNRRADVHAVKLIMLTCVRI